MEPVHLENFSQIKKDLNLLLNLLNKAIIEI